MKPDAATHAMNRTEEAYARHLELLRAAGEIVRFDFEPERMRLSHHVLEDKGSKPAFYTPDFRVLFPDGTIEFHEVKGHWEEAAKVRVRCAADAHPMYVFVIIKATTRGIKRTFSRSEVVVKGAA